MGALIDFQEAKNRLVNRESPAPDENLQDAVEIFAFSRLPKLQRTALILAGIYGGEAENHLRRAADVIKYADTDFAVPFKSGV